MISRTPSVIARPFGTRRQAIVSFGDTHMVIGSPMIRDTISGLSQPNDLLLATLVTDCTFACQDTAQALDIPLTSLTTTAKWNYDNGQAIIVHLGLNGLTNEQVEQLVEGIQLRAQMYRLISQVLPITFKTPD